MQLKIKYNFIKKIIIKISKLKFENILLLNKIKYFLLINTIIFNQITIIHNIELHQNRKSHIYIHKWNVYQLLLQQVFYDEDVDLYFSNFANDFFFLYIQHSFNNKFFQIFHTLNVYDDDVFFFL